MSQEFQVNMDEYLPLRDVVFNTLRKAILKGELKPGERLMEIALANRLGVSRTPIREAIRKLELEGLVVMIPRKGAQVASITEQDLKDVLEVRLALELLAVQVACKKMTEEQLDEMKTYQSAFEGAVIGKDVTEIAQADIDFHETIYTATENKRLIQMLHNLKEQMYRYRVEYLKDDRSHRKLVAEHAKLVDALEAKDEKTAGEIIEKHIQNQQMTILQNIAEGREEKV